MSRILWLSEVTWRFAFCSLFFTLTEWSFICLRSPVKQYMCFLEVDWYCRIRPFRISVWIKRTKRTNQKVVSHTHTLTLSSMHFIFYSSEFPCITYDVINHQIYNSKISSNQIFKFIQFVHPNLHKNPFRFIGKGHSCCPLCLCCQPSEYLTSLKQTKREMLKFLAYPWRSVSLHFNVLLYNESFWKDQLSFSATFRMVVAGVLFKRKKVCIVFFIPTWKRIFNVDRFLSICLCV